MGSSTAPACLWQHALLEPVSVTPQAALEHCHFEPTAERHGGRRHHQLPLALRGHVAQGERIASVSAGSSQLQQRLQERTAILTCECSRLGYLFSGPPGTGKSSLAFALASNFGLPVYMINLSAPGLSDNDIESLFSSVPRHCIVLLEDVDATQPLSRKLAESKGTDEESAVVLPLLDLDEEDTSPPPMPGRRGRRAGERRGNTVTLSGLLNAIDGVAASEGKSTSTSDDPMTTLGRGLHFLTGTRPSPGVM